MNAYIATFNCHINHAQDKARKDFISHYGRPVYMKQIYPYIRKGIMSIFHDPPNEYTQFFVDTIHKYVNEVK